MSVEVGDRVPESTFKLLSSEGMQNVSTSEVFDGKKVVVFAVPGAFTPTCSDVHLPGFIDSAGEMKAKGADSVVCIAVNDAFVLSAWRKTRGIPDDIQLLGDGNGEFTRAMGLELDASAFGMGSRSRRYAAIVDDGVVQYLGVEPAGEVGVSSADAVLKLL